jgi:hypothetical protein
MESSKSLSKALQEAEVPWSDAVIMICTKCAKKISLRDSDVDLSDGLKHAFKAQIKGAGLQPKIRTVTTSCLDICPDDRIAIAFALGAPQHAVEGAFEAVTMHKNADLNQTAAEVIEKIKSRL